MLAALERERRAAQQRRACRCRRRAPPPRRPVRPLRAGLRNSKPSVRVRRESSATSLAASACCFCSRPMWVSFACACFALSFLARKRSTKRSSRAMSASTPRHLLLRVQRARRLLAPPCVPRPGEERRAPGGQLQRRGRHRLEEPAVVRDEDHGGVEREQLALEPLEAGRRRGGSSARPAAAGRGRRRARARARRASARRRRTCAAAGRGARRRSRGPRRTEAAVVAPAVAARVLEPRLRRRVAVQRALVVRAAGHRLLEPRQLLLEPTRSRAPESTYSRRVRPARAAGAGRAARCASPSRTRARRRASPSRRRGSGAASSCPAPFGPESATRSRRSTLNETPSKSRFPASSLRRLDAITTAMPHQG